MEYIPRADESSFPALGNATDWPIRVAVVAPPGSAEGGSGMV